MAGRQIKINKISNYKHLDDWRPNEENRSQKDCGRVPCMLKEMVTKWGATWGDPETLRKVQGLGAH